MPGNINECKHPVSVSNRDIEEIVGMRRYLTTMGSSGHRAGVRMQAKRVAGVARHHLKGQEVGEVGVVGSHAANKRRTRQTRRKREFVDGAVESNGSERRKLIKS